MNNKNDRNGGIWHGINRNLPELECRLEKHAQKITIKITFSGITIKIRNVILSNV